MGKKKIIYHIECPNTMIKLTKEYIICVCVCVCVYVYTHIYIHILPKVIFFGNLMKLLWISRDSIYHFLSTHYVPNTYIISSNLTQTSEELKELSYLHKVREVAKSSAGIQIQAIQGQRPGSCSQSQWVLIIEKVLKDNNMAKFVLNWLYFLNKSML